MTIRKLRLAAWSFARIRRRCVRCNRTGVENVGMIGFLLNRGSGWRERLVIIISAESWQIMAATDDWSLVSFRCKLSLDTSMATLGMSGMICNMMLKIQMSIISVCIRRKVRTRYADREPSPSLFPPSEIFTRGMSGIDRLSHPCSKHVTLPTTTWERRGSYFYQTRRIDTHSHVAALEWCETIGADVRRLLQQ